VRIAKGALAAGDRALADEAPFGQALDTSPRWRSNRPIRSRSPTAGGRGPSIGIGISAYIHLATRFSFGVKG
jgi:hypothetical protein